MTKLPRLQNPPQASTVQSRTSDQINADVEYAKRHPNQWVLAMESASPGNAPTYQKRGVEVKRSSVDQPKGRVAIFIKWVEDES